MFGDMFDDEVDVNAASNDQITIKSGKESIPKPRCMGQVGGTNIVGIINQGATCFLNSLIQTLFFTPELRDAVFSLAKEELGSRGDVNYRIIPSQLQLLFANMLLLDQANVSTTDLTDSFGWKNREDFCQHDVQELNRILFSALEDSLVGLTGASMISDLYRGTIVNQIRCTECGNVSEREENFLDLTVAVAGYSSLADSLTDSYLNTEDLTGKNQYLCSHCDKLVDGEKGAKLRDLPPLLTFCLLRLTFDIQTMQRKKETSYYTFPQEISMGAYMDAESEKCLDYELLSVVVHRGGAHGGHYHALIKDIDELGHWTKPNGKLETSEKVPSRKAEKEYLQFESPTDLLDHILLSDRDWVSTDYLSQRIVQETGVSWNKRFKKRYQSLARFLSNHPDRYLFDEACKKVKSCFIEDTADPDKRISEVANCSPETLSTETDAHWFSLDDRKVRPANKSDIEKYFGGKECAYMLYYRQKSLTRPADAKGNVYHHVPEHLVATVSDINSSMRLLRESEEQRLNTMAVKVFLPTEYTFRNGFITCKAGHKYMEFLLDQRKMLDECLDEMFHQLPTEEVLGRDSDWYLVKQINDVIHLLEKLSDGSPSARSLSSIGLNSDRGLLLLSQRLIDKQQVPCGLDDQPYRLTFVYELVEKELLLAKSLSLQELPALAMSEIQAEPPIYLYTYIGKSKQIHELPTHENTPLHKHLQDSTVVKISHRNIQESNAACQKIKLFVEGMIEEINMEKCSFHVDPSDSVSSFAEDVQKFLTDQYKVSHNLSFRLRRSCNNTHGLPLFTDRTIEESHLSDGDHLLIEKGIPATSSQMVLYYHENVASTITYSIVCRCTQTISQCIQQMVENAALSGGEYYITTLDWIGEPLSVVYNTNQSLAKAKIKHGDGVLLIEGLPPPKDAVVITVKWQPQNRSNGVCISYAQWLVNLMGDLTLEDSEIQPCHPMYSCWSTKVSRKTSIEEIKCQLKPAIDAESAHPVESVNQIQLRSITGTHPSTIYKVDSKTLEQYKVRGATSTFLAEILSPEEDVLRQDDILLLLRKRDRMADDYGVEERFKWDTSNSSTAAHLRRAIAAHLECSASHLHLALFVPECLEWRIISDTISSITSRSKRGRSRPTTKTLATNLKKAPYQIEDGDLVGYIIASEDCEAITEDMFQTSAEQRLKQIGLDKKRKRRKEKANEDEWLIPSNDQNRRQEKAISIQVGNFTN